jgi:sugar phosphate isomerase/epimerase
MKIAFDCSALSDLREAADLANRCGLDGIEILFESASQHLKFENLKFEICAINLGLKIDQILPAIAISHELNCQLVRVRADPFFGRSETALPRMIGLLQNAGDVASEAGVTILIENQPTAGSALRLWNFLDRLNHPGIGCCWNTLSAARAHDTPAVAVPMLNSRIRYVHLQDAKISGNSIVACPLGDGDLPLRNTTNRLRGIGFSGYLLIGVATAPPADETHLAQSLNTARAILQQWQVLPQKSPQAPAAKVR